MRHALFIRATTLLLLLTIVLWSAFSFIPQAHAATFTFTSCPTGTTLHNAVSSAAPGDTIQFRISGSPCMIDLSGTGGGTLMIDKNLTFDASGSPQSVTLSGGQSVQVLQVSSTFTLQNIIIANGFAGFLGGGGILNFGTVTISNSAISNNSSSSGGGISNTSSGTVTISNSAISNNSSSSGGGIFNGGTVTISDSTVSNNSASFGSGGGIFNAFSGTMTISNSTISSNTGSSSGSDSDGGGIWNGGTVTINNSTIANNSINFGGGIFNASSGKLTISQSTVVNNSSASDGGGIYNGDSNTFTISQSTVANNSSHSSLGTGGGGIWNGGPMTISNSTIANNSATSGGGGIVNNGTVTINSTVTMSNSTVANNSAPGGGILNVGGTVNIAQSIVANNRSSNCTGPITDRGYNLENVTGCTFTASTDLQNTNPQFQGGLQNNGGPTQTIALQPTSPAVNHIPVNTGPGCIPGGTDQRGQPRPDRFLLQLLPESTCDIGAYEVQGELLR